MSPLDISGSVMSGFNLAKMMSQPNPIGIAIQGLLDRVNKDSEIRQETESKLGWMKTEQEWKEKNDPTTQLDRMALEYQQSKARGVVPSQGQPQAPIDYSGLQAAPFAKPSLESGAQQVMAGKSPFRVKGMSVSEGKFGPEVNTTYERDVESQETARQLRSAGITLKVLDEIDEALFSPEAQERTVLPGYLGIFAKNGIPGLPENLGTKMENLYANLREEVVTSRGGQALTPTEIEFLDRTIPGYKAAFDALINGGDDREIRKAFARIRASAEALIQYLRPGELEADMDLAEQYVAEVENTISNPRLPEGWEAI